MIELLKPTIRTHRQLNEDLEKKIFPDIIHCLLPMLIQIPN